MNNEFNQALLEMHKYTNKKIKKYDCITMRKSNLQPGSTPGPASARRKQGVSGLAQARGVVTLFDISIFQLYRISSFEGVGRIKKPRGQGFGLCPLVL